MSRKTVLLVLIGILSLTFIIIFNQHTFVREYQAVNTDFKYNKEGTFGYKITEIAYFPDKSLNRQPWVEAPKYRLFLTALQSNVYHNRNQSLLAKVAFPVIRFLNFPTWNDHPGRGKFEIHGTFFVQDTAMIDNFCDVDCFSVRLNSSSIRTLGYRGEGFGLDKNYPDDRYIGFDIRYKLMPRYDFNELTVIYECPDTEETITHTLPIKLKKEIFTFFDWEKTKYFLY